MENRQKDNFRTEPVKYVLLILLAFQVCLIAHSNLTLIDKNIDCDLAKLFVHIAEVGKQGTLFLPDWDYLTTLEWDCSSILAIPFYAITNNIVLSFALANIVFLGCFLGLIFFLFRGEDIVYPLFCTNLLIIPFRTGMLDYYNMLFFGGAQYLIKVSIPILLVGIILSVEHLSFPGQEHKKKEIPAKKGFSEKKIFPRKDVLMIKILMAVYLGLLFLSSVSSGVYVMVCGIVPIFLAYTGYKFLRWESVSGYAIFLMICSCILTLAGWRINTRLMGGALGNGMTLCSVQQLLQNISSCFFGMFELFGGATEYEGLPVLSSTGIQVVAKCCLVLVILISGIAAIVKCIRWIKVISVKNDIPEKENIPPNGNLRSLLLLSIFLWNYFVLNVSYSRAGSHTYEYRYHLIGILPLVCAVVFLWIESIRKLQSKQQNCFHLAGCMAILFFCVISYQDLYSAEEQNSDLKELCAYTKDYNIDYVYLYKDIGSSEICRLIMEENYPAVNSSYLCLLEEGVTYTYDYYNYYNDTPMQTENVIVAIDDREYTFGDYFEIAGHTLKKFNTISNWSLYYFEQ